MAVRNDSYENNVEYAPFNSINRDRAINANHLARWLSSVNSDGVARKFDEFETEVSGGMNVTVGTGVGFVDGHHIYLKSSQTIEIEEASVSGDRIDTIGFRLEKTNRKVVLYYKTGEVGSGTAPVVLNNDNSDEYIEVPLYHVNVPRGATSISSTNGLSDVRVYVVSSATFFKKYTYPISVTANRTTLTIPEPFNSSTDDVEILNNGIPLLSSQYSISGNTITLKSPILAGNSVQINVWHFQDSNGSMDSLNVALARISEVEKVMKYYYFCTGSNDNIALSTIAQNFLTGAGDFTGINANAQMELIICGDCGVSNYNGGTGTQANPYVYFAFGRTASTTRTIYFNFSNCSRINIACPTTSGTYATIFSGADINVRNVALNVGAGYNVDIFNGTNVHCEDSEFWMTTTNNCCVGRCCGYFENVRTSITSTGGNAYCFYSNGNLTRIVGGTHYAWTGSSSSVAVCFYVIDAAANNENVLFITMANCPQSTRSGLTQTDTIQVNRGYCTAIMNTLWKAATFGENAETTIAYGNVIVSKN